MDVQEILKQLTAKFGNSFDVTKVTDLLKTFDLKSLSFGDIVGKLTAHGLLNNVNLDNVKDGVLGGLKDKAGDVLKDKAADMLKSKAGGMLGGLFGK